MKHILYSFRRCPYAIRARFALIYADIRFELREVKLSDKPQEMLDLSPKGTVPVLQLPDGQVIHESVDIVEYALSKNDPKGYALQNDAEKSACKTWLTDWQPRWVKAIQQYKYHDRYPELNRDESWGKLKCLLIELNNTLETNKGYLLNGRFTQLDILALPLIRQFAIIDDAFFRAQGFRFIESWLDHWMSSNIYDRVMAKQTVWVSKD